MLSSLSGRSVIQKRSVPVAPGKRLVFCILFIEQSGALAGLRVESQNSLANQSKTTTDNWMVKGLSYGR